MSGSPVTSTVRRIRRSLESRKTSFWVLGAWLVMTIVWVVPFQLAGQSDETVTAIAQNWFAFRAIYVAVAVTTLLCTFTRFARDLRVARRSVSWHTEPTDDALGVSGMRLATAEGELKARGYSVSLHEKSIHAVKYRYSTLGGSLFHLGIVVFGVALVANMLTIESIPLRVTEGQGLAEAALASGVGLPASLGHLTLQSIDPEYFEDVLLFTRLDAEVSVADGSVRGFSLSRPYWAGFTTIMSIADYGLAPHIEVTSPDGQVAEYVVAMNLVPPGNEDMAELPEFPMKLSMIAYPDYGVVDGRDVSLSYNIADPAFVVVLEQLGGTGSLLARELVRIGDPVTVDGYTVRITELSRYGTFRVTEAPMIPLVVLGLLLMVCGLAWRFLYRRHTVVVWEMTDGVLVDGWLDMSGRATGRAKALLALGVTVDE